MRVDLKELSIRESERVEWKENVADFTDVVRTIVAFANDFSNLGGGYVVCGAEETRDSAGFQKVQIAGLSSARFKEVENHVLAHCRDRVDPPVVALLDEIPLADADRRVLVFIVPSTGYAHTYKPNSAESSKYFIRIGRETREARNGLLRELLVRKGALEPWDRRINRTAKIEDIDLLKLRDLLQQMGLWDSSKPLEDYLSGTEQLSNFVPPLAGGQGIEKSIFPRNFTLLFFGKNPLLTIPGAFTIFSIYRGKDRSEPTAERVEVVGTIAEQARKLIELLNTEAYTSFDKNDPQPNQVKYPKRALQEAIVNAIAHRDYELDQPIRVTVFLDRIEIASPGALPRAIDPEKFKNGQATAYWRNQALAYFLNKLQLAQAEGQGIPTILRTMHEEGCPPPRFEIGDQSVTCVLPAHPRHALMRELSAIENKIIIGDHEEAANRLEELLKLDPYNVRTLELFCEANNMLRTPSRLFRFVEDVQLDPKLVGAGTLLVLSETLSQIPEIPKALDVAKSFMSTAVNSRLEESEVKHAALVYRKLKNDEKAIDLIENVMKQTPSLASSASLREIAAKARMDLAKRCMETARAASTKGPFRAKAWSLCREYLSQAERDLSVAMSHAKNEVEIEYIQKDVEFLNYMRQISQRPTARPVSRAKRSTPRKHRV